MDILKPLIKIDALITKFLQNLVAFLFFLILVIVVLLVIMRYVFNTGIFGGNEAILFFFIYTTAIGAAVSVRTNSHISIDYFKNKIKNKKIKKGVNILNLILVSFINYIMISSSIPWIMKVGNNESPVLRIPNAFIQSVIPISCVLVIGYAFFLILLEVLDIHEIVPNENMEEVKC